MQYNIHKQNQPCYEELTINRAYSQQQANPAEEMPSAKSCEIILANTSADPITWKQ